MVKKIDINRYASGKIFISLPESFQEKKIASSAKSAKSISETSFVFVLGQIITRMKVIAEHAYLYGIGLPESSAKIAIRRLPWKVAEHLCLYIFSVSSTGKVKRYSPQDLKKIQNKESKN